MATAINIIPAIDAEDWSQWDVWLKYLYTGYYNVSLTNWTTGTTPQIVAGSALEMDGDFYQFDSNESIGGTASGTTSWVQITKSGQNITASWYNTATPTWSASKNTYINGANRVLPIGLYSGSKFIEINGVKHLGNGSYV